MNELFISVKSTNVLRDFEVFKKIPATFTERSQEPDTPEKLKN